MERIQQLFLIMYALGAHSNKNIRYTNKVDLEKKLNINLNKKIFLITFHPTTLEKRKIKISDIKFT